jgi:very-short-patch-repair endonuclease
MLPYNKNLKEHARQLRGNMTDAERHLWAKIRMKQLKGYQFYRQKPIGDYIVDFFCPEARLIIEVDGSQHFINETIEYDRIREEYVSSLGLKVLRFTNSEVLKHVDGVVERIEEEMKIPLNPPFSKGETRASPFEEGGDMTASPPRKRKNERHSSFSLL